MSHSVTVTRTTTSTTTSALILNTGYFKSYPGLLKFAELVLGIVCVGIVAHYMSEYNIARSQVPELFFLLMTTTFMIATFILLISCLVSISTGSIISKTIYEVLYHGFAFVLLLIAGLTLLIIINDRKYSKHYYDPYMAAAIICIINSVLYLLSTIIATKSYRGI